MNASFSKTGKTLNAIRHNVKFRESVLRTYLEKISMSQRPTKRLTNEQLKARLVVFIGVCLAMVFALSVL